MTDKHARIRGIIKYLHDNKMKIDVNCIIMHSLFSIGGTLTGRVPCFKDKDFQEINETRLITPNE